MRSALAVLIPSLLALAPAPTEGCGDKFQRVGRGSRFQRGYVALHPACILLYARPQSPVAKALRDLEPVLKRAGHVALLVDRPESLVSALKARPYDVVLTELAEVATIEARARAIAVPAPPVLPVLHRPSAEAKAEAEKEYGCLVASPGKQVDVLAEIDGLMERLAKNGPASPAPKR